ncbi:helix-turn-helix domain-containing protein [Amycolatopsis rhabdoformis]|uniref:Helix-turn-helix domain-containing protein n=1 Tax=Amycolatopsis rhabdoformis TaxID=1448059 RepID=A0ABZ1IFN0_9PSEU|nr:helix-turn-helix domain-containing protein [Amycolatopsis rhabdoformis]WSE32463.1 helix-turn-helix domain-containing protein [Amycolatopsis rhabdoformis]
MTGSSGGAASAGDIQAVSRAAQILALFSPERPLVTVAQGAELLGLNRTTVNRYFLSLEAAGLMQRNPDQPTAYEPSRLLCQLGAFALSRQRVTEIAPPLMRDLASESGLTVTMALWGSVGPVVVHVAEQYFGGASVSVRVGSQLGIDTAQAQVFLAYHQDRLLAERLLGAAPRDVREGLERKIDRIRTDHGGSRVSLFGVSIFAAPVFDVRGICATIAVLGTSELLPMDGSRVHHDRLLRTARDITDRMGGTWPEPGAPRGSATA